MKKYVTKQLTDGSILKEPKDLIKKLNLNYLRLTNLTHAAGKLEREILIESIKYTVDHLNLKAIIVYDVCHDNKEAETIFKYAIDRGIKVIIPPNMIKERNQINQERRKKIASK